MTQPERRQRRPTDEVRAAQGVTTGDTHKVHRTRWAQSLIERASVPVPRYGSPAWLALPESSPEKVAAVVVAAECWAVEGDDLVARVDAEMRRTREAERRLDGEAFEAEVVPMVRALAKQPALGTTYAQRRAAEMLQTTAVVS